MWQLFSSTQGFLQKKKIIAVLEKVNVDDSKKRTKSDNDDDAGTATDNFYCLVPKTERTENEKIWLLSCCLINNLLLS